MEKNNYEGMSLITDNAYVSENTESLRETFLSKYCTEKGWDAKNLTVTQLNEIKSQKGYKNPDMLFS